MSNTIDVDRAGPSMWRASERFPLGGTHRVASLLPDDLSMVPFGLTRVVRANAIRTANLDVSHVTYDPITQMSKVDDKFVILAGKVDTYCREDTITDMQRFSDNNRDDSIEQ